MSFNKFKLLSSTIILFFNFLLLNFAQGPTILKHGGSVRTVKFSPVNNALIASAGDSNTIKLWNLRDSTVATLRGHTDQVNSVAFSPDGQLLASGGDDWRFKLWDVRTQQNIATLEHITDRTRSQIKAVAFSPDGQLLATAGSHLKLWNVNSQTEMATVEHDEYVWASAFSPDGQLHASGDGAGLVKIWDIRKRQVVSRLELDADRVYTLAFSPDGRILASAGYNGQIKLWAVSNWALLGTLQNRGTTYALDFSPDGKILVSTGHGVVTLWSVDNGMQITSLTGHAAWSYGATFAPDGKTLASSGDDGTVLIHNIEPHLRSMQQRKTVRLIYFLPLNRRAQPDINTKLDTLIKDTQQFYAEQMHAHGFGRKTFTFETDATGNAVVHHVNGGFTDAYYDSQTLDKVTEEIEERFSLSTNIYLIAIETGSESIDLQWCGKGGSHWFGGRAIVPASGACFASDTVGHELGHAFGLEHDFRDEAYLMSYGSNPNQLSRCAAEWLDAHPYFNTHQSSYDEPATITMLTPLELPQNTIHFRFEVTDADGLHQAQLTIPTGVLDPAGGLKLHSCQELKGESNLIQFKTAQVNPGPATEITLRVIDVSGNYMLKSFPIGLEGVAQVDTNSDGVIDLEDLMIVAAHFGTTVVRRINANADVNNDGFVNREDLLLIVEALESQEGAPAAPNLLATANLQRWILEAAQHNSGDAIFQRGIAVLRQLLIQSRPTETVLLSNYPNPFNPETWIPYLLAQPAEVTLRIYAPNGALVRALDLGHQPAGVYQTKSRAAHWDGKNELGERVASGLYFYTLTAGEFTATRKMLIKK